MTKEEKEEILSVVHTPFGHDVGRTRRMVPIEKPGNFAGCTSRNDDAHLLLIHHHLTLDEGILPPP